ncbi:MAG: ABC transporter permease [Eubacteriales bacterium]
MKKFWADIKQYPTAIIGLIMIFIVIFIAIYAMISIPYNEAVTLWRANEEDVYRHPEKVPPTWINSFRNEKLPEGFYCILTDDTSENYDKVTVEDNTVDGVFDVTYYYEFEFDADDYYQEIMYYIRSEFDEKQPYIEASIITPDGREIRTASGGTSPIYRYKFTADEKLERRVGKINPIVGIFSTQESIDAGEPELQKGTYIMKTRIRAFEPDTEISAEIVVHGRVYGMAGTDHMRRDVSTALLWGAPIALAFGLIAAFGISILTMTIAATGTWVGGWLDELIQRLTEVNMMLPFLPILIMVGTFYSRSLWVILGTVILLSIFSASIKTYRAIFLQVKQSTYIEAAKVYGASNSRIIFRYMIPKIIPMLIPGLVLSIPSYVFLEASLAVLGLGDPTLPTWGKMIHDAYADGALWTGEYYWILEPAVLLIITGFSFAMVGFALDRIFNPRLRDQ